MKPARNAFTLVELLVALAIIAILSAIGFIAYSSVIKQGRDSKRMSDLRTIQSALEQYYRDQGFYPAYLINGDPGSLFHEIVYSGSSLTNQTGQPAASPTKTYLNQIPYDPVNKIVGSTRYLYTYKSFPGGCSTNCTSYCLYTNVENLSNAKLPSNSICNGHTDNNGNYNYGVVSP